MEPETWCASGVGLVPEGRRLFKELTVTDNLRLGAATRKDKEAARGPTSRRCSRCSPSSRSGGASWPGLLSGGEAQQLAIARTMMTVSAPARASTSPRWVWRPCWWTRSSRCCWTCASRGYTILLVEQNALQVLEFVDRAYVLRNGEIKMEASAESMQDEKKLLQAYLGVGGLVMNTVLQQSSTA